MKPPIFVRELSEKEREWLEAGLRSKDAFVLRRCQILLASARRLSPPKIAESLGCASQTVRNAIRAFNERGLDALVAGSSRPNHVHAAFDGKSAEALREMLHRSPREFGRNSSLWTLEMAADPEWATGFEDECWWSREALPTLNAWSEDAEPWRLVQRSVEKDDPEPKAISCYRLYVPELDGETWIRFVDGRPVSSITTRFLEWSCQKLQALGKKVLLLIWDSASWHVSKEVRRWLGKHNQGVKKSGEGVRIVSCLLPKKRPWLNAIEPKWVHGKRKVVEPDGLLGAYELAERVCGAFGCPHHEHLTVPQKVA